MSQFESTCQMWVRDYITLTDGAKWGVPHRCGADLILEVSGATNLSEWTRLGGPIPAVIEDVPVEYWEVKCESGHLILKGVDESGDFIPFSLEALWGLGYQFHDPLPGTFAQLTKEWQEDTKFDPSTLNIVTHPAYEQIIAMGERVLPLIFAEMAKTPDTPNHWFGALREITGRDVAKGEDTIDGAAEKWLAWWRRVKYIYRAIAIARLSCYTLITDRNTAIQPRRSSQEDRLMWTVLCCL